MESMGEGGIFDPAGPRSLPLSGVEERGSGQKNNPRRFEIVAYGKNAIGGHPGLSSSKGFLVDVTHMSRRMSRRESYPHGVNL
jgi:hypothetical protein